MTPSRSFLSHYVVAFACGLVLAVSTMAGTVPGNLGSGLDVLMRERQAQLAAQKGRRAPRIDATLAQQAADYRDVAFINDVGHVKVYVHLRPRSFMEKSSYILAVLPESALVSAVDENYRAGVIEAFVSLDDIPALAMDPRVSSVILAVRPTLDVGVVTTQGVVQHRLNLIPQTGAGITVGVMSDSYNRSTNPITAATDVSTGDLPGVGNPAGNTTPVVVLDDPLAGSTDEGRAMMQIVHDMAPAAKLGFATASAGQVSFADNIRSLAGVPGASHTVPGFSANVIVDDLYYSDSPMFGTSLVGKAVNQVAALGVSYFSSAGNRASQQGYFSDARIVTVASGQTANPTLNFATVPAALYAGGFHNFRTDGGTDISQTIVGGGNISFQWDDPFDVAAPTFNPTPFFNASGTATSTTTPAVVNVPGLVAGSQYRVTVNANASALDAVVQIVAPSGATIVNQDSGTDEEIFFFAPETGSYTVNVRAFSAGTTGAFTLNAYAASGVQRITTDYNLLFFNNTTGAFISSIAANNVATNQPLELAALPAGTIQMVIARANVPTAPVPATKVRYVMTSGRPLEYFDYQTPITFGHNHEPGCISVAAYSPFRPYIPEDFTSPGPSYIYFDQNANRLASPVIRQKPDVAAMDGANTTFFSSDSASDADTFPNFFGTSAAAPHAAGIAALVLQANGGPGSVSQQQMRLILQGSGQSHDLDPFVANASVATPGGGTLALTARANSNSFNFGDSTSLSTNDPNVFAVTYTGAGYVKTLFINATGGNTTGGYEPGGVSTSVPGLVWDSRTFATGGFPFTVGSTTGTLLTADISNAYTGTPPSPAVAGQFNQLELTFADNKFTGGSSLTFGADRDMLRPANLTATSSVFGNSADLFGATVEIPSGTVAPGGVTFSGTMNGGAPFSGTFVNNIGLGYSTLDGYGFINGQEAVTRPPTAAGVTISGRVFIPGGRGLRGAVVAITNESGATSQVLTNGFGLFSFTDIEPGHTYIITVRSRRFEYSPQVILINDSVADVDFWPGNSARSGK